MTVAHFDPEVIAGDANFTAEDPSGLLFGIISSSMFLAWQRTAGGRIKSDLRFSARVVWNNLPLPQLTDQQRDRIIAAGQEILDVRSQKGHRSLAEHYAPLTMDRSLVKAHEALDSIVDRAFGATRACRSERERQEVLFARYAEATAE